MLPGDRKIRDKAGLVSALRSMTADNAAARLRESSTVRDGPPPLAAEEGAERPMSATSRSLSELEAAVHAATRRLNVLRDEAEKKAALAAKLESDLEAARSENKALDVKETPEGARIAELEAEIEKVEAAYSEKDFRRRQLEHMEARLTGNATAMDAHIKSMEDALGVSGKELSDIQGFLRQLENGKEQAVHELEAFHARMQSERARRAKELAAKREEFQQAKKAEAWRRQRESVRAELAAELAGDLSKEQEDELKATKDEKERLYRGLEIERREREERAAALHEAFQQIKGITGVATLDEMTERFLGHEAARESLHAEREETEQRLAAARAAVARAERELSELRATGQDSRTGAGADADATQEAFAAAERELAEGRSRLRRLVTAADRVQGMVVAVRQGAAGIAQRLAPFRAFLDPAEAAAPAAPDLSPLEVEAFGFVDRSSLRSPPSGSAPGFDAPASPLASPLPARDASPTTQLSVPGPPGGRVDVQKQGREAFRLLLASQSRLRRLVSLVNAAVVVRKRERRGTKYGRYSGRSTRAGSAGSGRLGGSGPPGSRGAGRAAGLAALRAEADGVDRLGGVNSDSDLDSASSFDSDDPRAEARRRDEAEEQRAAAAAARERAKREVMVNAPTFTLFGMRGRKSADAATGSWGARQPPGGLALPMADPVPHANNIRVQPAAAASAPGAGSGTAAGDQGSVAGSAPSSARSRAPGGAAQSSAGSPREAQGDDEEAHGGDDGKSVLSAGGAHAVVRARRRRRRKEEDLPSHRALKDAADRKLRAKRAEAVEAAAREKNKERLHAEAVRRATLNKLTKTTRAPTGMDFLTKMPKLL